MATELTPDQVMSAVERVMGEPWEWGRVDCCTSAADVFMELHGIDLARDYRGTYSTSIGAARLIKSRGGFRSMIESMAAAARLTVSNGECGDIGLSGHTLVICVQAGIWAGKTEAGFATVPTADRAWNA